MADYGGEYGGAQLSHGIAGGMNAVAEAIRRMQLQHQKQKAGLDTVQGYLDAAKTVTVTDPKTGKPKQLFTPDQVQFVQQALDQKNAELAGARAAALGIGKNVLQRAAQANAQSQMTADPFVMRDGRRYLRNPKTGALTPDLAVPRNAQTGQTFGQQFNEAVKLHQMDNADRAAKQKGVDAMLKQYGVNRGDLFDPSKATAGTVDKDGNFTPVGGATPAPAPQGSGIGKILNEIAGSFGGQATIGTGEQPPSATPAPPAVPTHFQVGYVPPTWAVVPGSDTNHPKYRMADKGRPGAIITQEQYNALQDEAAKAAPPFQAPDGSVFSAQQALDWLRNTDNSKQDPALADQIRKKLAGAIVQSSSGTEAPIAQPEVESGSGGGTKTQPAISDTEDASDESGNDEEE